MYYFLHSSLLNIFSFKRNAGENAIVLLKAKFKPK